MKGIFIAILLLIAPALEAKSLSCASADASLKLNANFYDAGVPPYSGMIMAETKLFRDNALIATNTSLYQCGDQNEFKWLEQSRNDLENTRDESRNVWSRTYTTNAMVYQLGIGGTATFWFSSWFICQETGWIIPPP